MSVLVQFCNRDGNQLFMTEVVDVVPRIGESVFVSRQDETLIDTKVVGVHHSFIYGNESRSCDVRVSVLLDVN